MNRKNDKQQSVRCAIYTRKSTTEGLEQEFNTLDAQREAGQAYIASQRGEGWVCLPDRYDDGGFTGGNMERPALWRLLADIEAGGVDCIVVYKVDRLSRSLIDFSRIMDVLERHSVSFVSVTQQFNTSTSMGRLMLNVLLSFAQFEREIISERTRDKIAATRRKGKWSGGMPVLGYDVAPNGGRLVVNEDEAARVQGIFELYLERQSVIETAKELDIRGWTTKRWVTKKGHQRGGKPWSKGSLFRLLTNCIYLGQVSYKGEVYEGEHQAIVDEEIFSHVQRLLKRNGRSGGKHVRNRFGALLKGLIRCVPCGCGMVPTHSTRNGNKRYRYYVCQNAQSRGWNTCPSPSVPAGELERFVAEQIKSIGQDSNLLADTLEESRQQREEAIGKLEAEKRALEREQGRYNAELQKLAGKDGLATDRMADLQDRIRTAEQRATEVREQVVALSRELVDPREVAEACSPFDPLWETLTAREQARILHLLVERVDYDGQNGNVSITFRPTGIKTLAAELSQQEVTA
ncbi:MAG: recombinase family protein [Anaerolineaceae bacterium]|nr:recombinase family protein [Anaerolineaceae bacterium]